METFFGLLGIVMLVFGILQIILFFKVWRMTNDIHIIKKHIHPDKNYAIREINKNNPNIEGILFDMLYEDMDKAVMDGRGEYEFVRENYRPLYKKAGIVFPAVFENINSDSDWYNVFVK